jgi:hypothetical protein
MGDIPIVGESRQNGIKKLVLQVAMLVDRRRYAQALFDLTLLQGQLLVAAFEPHPEIVKLVDTDEPGQDA